MIDIHTHILPGVDDGSDSMATSIQMARMAAKCGVTTIVATPHCNIEGEYENYESYIQEEIVQEFRQELKDQNINIDIVAGMEVYATEEVPELLLSGNIITLNYSRYLLIEFDFRENPSLIDYVLDEIRNQGLRPIIAHPERYPYVQDNPCIVYDWIYQGCSLQVNKGSILGSFGSKARNVAHYLMNQNLVSFIASDAHGMGRRTTNLGTTYQYISDHYSDEYADILFKENPNRVLEDLELIQLGEIRGRL